MAFLTDKLHTYPFTIQSRILRSRHKVDTSVSKTPGLATLTSLPWNEPFCKHCQCFCILATQLLIVSPPDTAWSTGCDVKHEKGHAL